MSKWSGVIGFSTTREIRPGVSMPEITEKHYYGDVTRNMVQPGSADKVIDDINISNSISIVADPFAYQNFHHMKYIVYLGAKWKIRSVEVLYPRLILTIGGVYNDGDGEAG